MYSVGAAAVNEYDWVLRPWTVASASVSTGSLRRTLNYQASLNYARTFGKHDVSALGLFMRRRDATGATFPNYREDWVSRFTYGYDNKYFAEVNGAYNGSEKFGPGYRFGFFPSLALGWVLSNERFMDYDWLYKLKVRGSIGKVGSDSGIPRWGYIGSWTAGGSNKYNMTYANALFGNTNGVINPKSAMNSPYTFYWEGTIPNPSINWETAIKKNLGIELGLFENMISFEADFFKENRKDIFMDASVRNIPYYFGAPAVPINYGQTETNGFELDLTYRKTLSNGLNYWVRQTMTRAKDLVTKAEDPPLQYDYLKTVGYQISQTKSQIRDGSIANSWDDVFAQTSLETNTYKLPGDWGILDFNGDGVINSFDSAPYGYPSNRPANTYSTYLGLGFKGLSFMIQFYGVTNITQSVDLSTPAATRKTRVNEYLMDYWTTENRDGVFMAPRMATGATWGEYTRFDGSFLRLKTLEVAYNLPRKLTESMRLNSMRVFVNGNNLIYWSDLPTDLESGSWDVYNSYPTYRVVNIGMDVQF